MPRESVYDDTGTFGLDVAWGRDSDTVQMVTSHNRGADAVVGIVNEWLEAAGLPLVDLAQLRESLGRRTEHPAGPLSPHFDGWHVTLNRGQINHVIRTLRRARDQAYGRDE